MGRCGPAYRKHWHVLGAAAEEEAQREERYLHREKMIFVKQQNSRAWVTRSSLKEVMAHTHESD